MKAAVKKGGRAQEASLPTPPPRGLAQVFNLRFWSGESSTRVVVDVEDYRKRRRSQIIRRARDVARRVLKTGRPEALEPMTAFERKIVHDAVAEVGGLETASDGEEPNRRVVVKRRM